MEKIILFTFYSLVHHMLYICTSHVVHVLHPVVHLKYYIVHVVRKVCHQWRIHDAVCHRWRRRRNHSSPHSPQYRSFRGSGGQSFIITFFLLRMSFKYIVYFQIYPSKFLNFILWKTNSFKIFKSFFFAKIDFFIEFIHSLMEPIYG